MALKDSDLEQIIKLVHAEVRELIKSEYARLQEIASPGIVVRNVGTPITPVGPGPDPGPFARRPSAASSSDVCCNGCD